MAEGYREFPPGARPEVEVLVDGVWVPGELRVWIRPGADLLDLAGRRSASWWGNISYRTGLGPPRVATVHQDRIRWVEPPVENEAPRPARRRSTV